MHGQVGVDATKPGRGKAPRVPTSPLGRAEPHRSGQRWIVEDRVDAVREHRRIATGDQALFVATAGFVAFGGYPDLPLMEDIVLWRRLKRLSQPLCVSAGALTSGRRWAQYGVMRTILTMWRLRLAFFFGVAPSKLAARYGHGRRQP